MSRLSVSDYQSVLDVLGEAGDVAGSVPFPDPVLEALRRLVPCDVVSYHESIGGLYGVTFAGDPRGTVTEEIRESTARWWHQDLLAPTRGARKISDLLSQRDFRRTELYQDAARPLGVEDMFRLWLDPRGARLEFDRHCRDFSERDRDVLDLLRPHLQQLRRRGLARLPAFCPTSKLTREREVLDLVSEGQTNAEIARSLWISPGTVRKHLENVYEKLHVHTRTGAIAAVRGS